MHRQGLARTFMHGIDASLREGADVTLRASPTLFGRTDDHPDQVSALQDKGVLVPN